MIYVLLPAFNEEKALPVLLKSFEAVLNDLKMEFLILVVDDGSTDGTAEVASNLSRQFPAGKMKRYFPKSPWTLAGTKLG